MNLKKPELRFKREWERVTKEKTGENIRIPNARVLPVAEEDRDSADLILQFDMLTTPAVAAYVTATGCQSVGSMGMAMLVKVPMEWLSAPTRLAFVLTSKDALHNALLDAGIADWLDLRYTSDKAALEVEFLEHPTSEQITALKAGYDVVTFDELVYTFVERTSGTEPQAEAAPLVDPAKVEAKVRQCWAGGHGGKIATLEAQADPREFIVTTVKPVPLNANLRNHGLALVKQIAPDVTHVRVMDELWAKLLSADKPAATTDTTEAVTISDGDTEPLTPPVDVAPLPELDERDLELNALKAQVDSLQDIIRALTPVASEWQTLRLTIKREGSNITAHPEIAVEEAKGWRVHSVQFAANGEDRLFVLMERKPQPVTAPRYTSAYATAGWPTANGRASHAIVNGSGGHLEQIMIREMNAEIEPTMNALAQAFGVNPEAWR